MKKNLIKLLALFMCLYFNSNAQDSSFTALVSPNVCVKITVTHTGDIVTYTREDIACTSKISSTLYNYSNAPMIEGSVEIPSDNGYWLIPFTNNAPILLRQNAVCLICNCVLGGGPGGGECTATHGGGWSSCANSNCQCCQGTVVFCRGQKAISDTEGGGVIVNSASSPVNQ